MQALPLPVQLMEQDPPVAGGWQVCAMDWRRMRSVLLRPEPIEDKIDAQEHALTLTRRLERDKTCGPSLQSHRCSPDALAVWKDSTHEGIGSDLAFFGMATGPGGGRDSVGR